MKHINLPGDINLKKRASELRHNATKEENHLWYDFLRLYPVRFHRQQIIAEYITDFYCPKAKLVIELDGSQHDNEKAKEYDSTRSHVFETMGLIILRVTNHEVLQNFGHICILIDDTVKHRIH